MAFSTIDQEHVIEFLSPLTSHNATQFDSPANVPLGNSSSNVVPSISGAHILRYIAESSSSSPSSEPTPKRMKNDPTYIPSDTASMSEDSLGLIKSNLNLMMTFPKEYLGLPKNMTHLLYFFKEKLKISSVQSIMIIFRTLKLNESYLILSHVFNVSVPTISRAIAMNISVLSANLKQLFYFPKPDVIRQNLPIQFRFRYFHVVSIINCFEIQIEKPSDPVKQKLTYSSYKGCNSLKYLISSTPDGFINFISKGYGGSASDIKIVNLSGYLDKLPNNSSVGR